MKAVRHAGGGDDAASRHPEPRHPREGGDAETRHPRPPPARRAGSGGDPELPASSWPRTLSGRLTLILLAGLLLAHGLTFWVVLVERGLAMRSMMGDYLARDLASSVAILDRLPAAERAAWLPRLERRNYRFALPAAADTSAGEPPPAWVGEVAQQVALLTDPSRAVRAVQSSSQPDSVHLQLALADGSPLSVHLDAPRLRVPPTLLAILTVQLLALLALSWLAVRQATRPLQQLAQAAGALDPGGAAVALPETGPREVVRAAAAFNAMQSRIRQHLADRTRILAAVSHDLQTPLTRLRLRVDLMDDDAETKPRLLADLDAMEALVHEGLAYAKSSQAPRETPLPLDLSSFLDSLVCDYTDAGRPVVMQDGPRLQLLAPPHALRRLLTNLVDNAIKFAGAAQLAAGEEDGGTYIAVRDRGPGIPAGELQAVREPFYRLEESRNRETGGTGLGLAIAEQLAGQMGAKLTLANREGGGLEARVCFGASPSAAGRGAPRADT
jgi:signal transduction histidine kinase